MKMKIAKLLLIIIFSLLLGYNFYLHFAYNEIDLSNELNIKIFGAKGNGKSDDTVAIQKALDYASNNGGGVLNFPAGTYIITGALKVPANITLHGSSASILRWTSGLKEIPSAGIQLQGENTRIYGLTLDLNNQTTLNGISVVGLRKFVIDSVVIKNGLDYGIWVFEGLENGQTIPDGDDIVGEGFIVNCDVSARDCYEIFAAQRVTISNCIARGDAARQVKPSTNGYYIWGRGKQVTLQGCFALGSYLQGGITVYGRDISEPTHNWDSYTSINGCHVDISKGYGIYIHDSSYVQGSGNTVNVEETGTGIQISQSDPMPALSKGIRLGATVKTGSSPCVEVMGVHDVELNVDLETIRSPKLIRVGGLGKNLTFNGGTFRLGNLHTNPDLFYGIELNAFSSLNFNSVIFKGSTQGYNMFNSPGTVNFIRLTNCTFDGVRINMLGNGSYRQVQNNTFIDSNNVIPPGGNFWINAIGSTNYVISGNMFSLTPHISVPILNKDTKVGIFENNMLK